MKALAASPLGLLIGLALGALGGGGSILAIPALVYVADSRRRRRPPPACSSSGWPRSSVWWTTGARGGSDLDPARSSAWLGWGDRSPARRSTGDASTDVLLLAFAGLVFVTAWRMLRGCPSCTREGERWALEGGGRGTTVLAGLRVDAPTVAKVVAAGTAVGFLTGLFGVGGGFIVVPALTLVLRFAMPEAIGTSLVVIAINAAVALAARVGHGGVDWAVTAPFMVGAVAGTLAGSRLADRLPARAMLRWFAGLLVAVAGYTALRSITALASEP